MQVTEKILEVERSNQFQETSFKIKASAKAFKILSSGLYANKIRAIVRELGTNAYDSHVMAGKTDKPFLVHLPNSLESFFSIRDYGIGLSEEDICSIYTTYFDSNKTNSNSVVGCLGLGSKSPFSYTDNFVVVSYFKGKKYTYTAFLSEQGLPSITKLNEEDTQESNGLEVILAVQFCDFERFRTEAEKVYKYFTNKPEVVGATVDLNMPRADYEGANWKGYRVGRNSNAGHVLVMGNVAYPVDLRTAGCHDSIFNEVALEIHCNIGEAEMTASRESLEYVPSTLAVIKRAVSNIMNQWKALLEAELAKQQCYWDACKFYAQHSLWLGNGRSWNGRPVHARMILSKALTYTTCKSSYSRYSRHRHGRWSTDNHRSEFELSDNIIFMKNDLERGLKARALQYIKQTNQNAYLVIYKFDDPAEEAAFIKELDCPAKHLMNASTMPKIKRDKNPNAGKKIVYPFDPDGTNNRSYWFERVELKDVYSAGGVYVELDMWDVKEFSSAKTLESVVRMMAQAGHPVKVYGFRKNCVKKIVNNPKWVPLSQKIKEAQAIYAADRELILNADTYYDYRKLQLLRDKVALAVDIQKVLDKIDKVVANRDLYNNVEDLVRYKSGVWQSANEMPELQELRKHYPLAFYVVENYTSNGWPIEAMVDYINMVNLKESFANASV